MFYYFCKNRTIIFTGGMSVLRIQEGRMFRQGQPDGSDSLRESPTFPDRLQERQQIL